MTDLPRELELFSELAPDELARVAALARLHHVKEGETVLRQNEPTRSVYVIRDGAMRVVDVNGTGEDVLAVLGDGDAFGEIGLVDNKPPSASVIAEEPSTLLEFDRERLLELIRDDLALGNKILWSLARTLARRMRATDQSLVSARQMMNRCARGI